MAGLLAQAQPEQQPEQPPQSGMVDMKQAQTAMPAMMDKLKRLVLAGQTILYSKEAGDKFLRFLDKDNIPQSVGEICAMVMAALIDVSNSKDDKARRPKGTTFPPNLPIPVGVIIAADLLDYACELYGVELTDDLSRQTITAFAESMQRGVKSGMEQGQPEQPQQAQQPQMAPQPAPQGVPA